MSICMQTVANAGELLDMQHLCLAFSLNGHCVMALVRDAREGSNSGTKYASVIRGV